MFGVTRFIGLKALYFFQRAKFWGKGHATRFQIPGWSFFFKFKNTFFTIHILKRISTEKKYYVTNIFEKYVAQVLTTI